jgi:hypothetical protein
MNVRIVAKFLRLLLPSKIWKREIFPAKNAAVRIRKDCLTDSAFAIEVAATIFHKIIIPLLHEVAEIFVLCKRTIRY